MKNSDVKKTVLVDFSMMSKDSIFSMNIYICRLLNGLYELNPSYKLCVLIPDGLDLTGIIPNDIERVFLPKEKNKLTKMVNKIVRIITGTNDYQYRNAVNRFNPNIFLSAYSGTTAPFGKVKAYKIQVVHDIYAKYVNTGWKKYRQFITIPLRLKNCSAVVGISQYEIKQIKKEYGNIVCNKPIHLIYNSVEVSNEVVKVNGIDFEYILYVGAMVEYKNVITLIKAFELLKNDYKLKLVLVGTKTKYFAKVLHPYICDRNLKQDVIVYSGLLESQLNYLYKHAKCFVLPSLREGFGYTPIEAILHKCPVIISQETALPEITENKTKSYANAMNEKELASKIKEVLTHPLPKAELENLASHFKQKYSVQGQARQFHNLIEDILSSL